MDVKLTKQFQNKLESLLESQDYKIRFEKGNFKSNHNDIIGFQLEILEELPNIHTKQDGKTIVEKLKCLL